MNKRQKKKHNIWFGIAFLKDFGEYRRHFFVKRKTKKRKRCNVHFLRELYKSHEYYNNWFGYDEDTGEYYEFP